MGIKKAYTLLYYIICTLAITTPVHLRGIQFDGEGCDKLNLVVASEECPSAGLFPTPGDCTIFFKCLRDNERMMPFLEYCGKGYNFNGTGCIPNSDKTDCPQFYCIVSSELTSALSDDKGSTNEENAVHQSEESSTIISKETIGSENDNKELLSSSVDKDNNNLDKIHKPKNTPIPGLEMPSAPVPYKSSATLYDFNFILSVTLISVYMVAI